jgi:CHASE3 domain sensor protein
MKESRKIIQFFLIFIGVFLIVATYFYYPTIGAKKENNEIVKEEAADVEVRSDKINTFEKVEYKGF